MPDLVLLKILTIYTNCQPFIYYSDPGAGPAHINCPSAVEYRYYALFSQNLWLLLKSLRQNQPQINMLLEYISEQLGNFFGQEIVDKYISIISDPEWYYVTQRITSQTSCCTIFIELGGILIYIWYFGS